MSCSRLERFRSFTALDAVPPEILIEIFVYCTTSSSPLAPLALGCVSSYWRQVVQSSPRVWQSIFLDDCRSIAVSHAQALLWTFKSYPLPIDVHVDISQASGCALLPLLSPLLSVMNRWSQFNMTGRREETLDFSGYLSKSIQSLALCIRDPDDVDPSEFPLSTFTLDFEDEFPSMNIWTTELPKPPSLLPLRFTSISMTEYSPAVLAQPRSILEFLSACPELEDLAFAGWQHENEQPTTAFPVVHLPRLQRLRLTGTCGTRVLLSHIDVPRLFQLSLQHLNVDWQLSSNMHEDGDSDDEANDFSRSKWSDHATGMGLRRLLLRSNPPLRVLEMDWSDMRTKDFNFAFSRLHTLEHFFIEASDMSDKVIALLRPFVPADAPDHCVRVRLPCLKTLELSNCNEISGDVIVDVLRARVRLTDALPKSSWDGNTLEEVIISDCAGFKGQHAELLRQELGDRLQRTD